MTPKGKVQSLLDYINNSCGTDFNNLTDAIKYAVANGGEGGGEEPLPAYEAINWAENVYTVGRTTTAYNGWIPHNLQYDDVNDKFLLLGCHRTGHTGAYSAITLSILDAEDPTVQTEVTVPDYKALGCLLVEDGTWYIYSRLANKRYMSTDMGTTWTEEPITVDITPYWFGMFRVGNKYFGCTDGYWNCYFISDDGINWSSCSFGQNDISTDTEIEGKEGGFAFFNGYYYAFIRSDTINYARVYKSASGESGTWTLVNESTIPSAKSCPMPIVYEDRITCVTSNRGDGHLYYCAIDADDNITVDDMGLRSVHPTAFGDFMTANIAYDGEHAIIAYCTQSSWDGANVAEYQSCEVVALYGTTKTNTVPVVTEVVTPITPSNNGLDDMAKLGVTLYPDGASVAKGTMDSSIKNTNEYPVFGVIDSDVITKSFLYNETTPYGYFCAYPIKNGKMAIPSSEWGMKSAPSANFNANNRFVYARWIEINGKLYLYYNRQGQKTLLRRDSFAYGGMPEGCPVLDSFTRTFYLAPNSDNNRVFNNIKYVSDISVE